MAISVDVFGLTGNFACCVLLCFTNTNQIKTKVGSVGGDRTAELVGVETIKTGQFWSPAEINVTCELAVDLQFFLQLGDTTCEFFLTLE